MEPNNSLKSIDSSTVDNLLKDYPKVLPSMMLELDGQRYETIPTTLTQRASSGSPYLTKQEVATLVDWKLSHGKFRPTLKSLVQQNAEESVQSITRDGFSALSDDSKDSVKKSLTILTKLKGIGPATASLLLSVLDSQNIPFFSDELFRWCLWDGGKGKGWDREIKYNVKEYLDVLERVNKLRTRLSSETGASVAAVKIEKVAYVLGKQGVDVGGSGSISSVVDSVCEKQAGKRKAEVFDENGDPARKLERSTKLAGDTVVKKSSKKDVKGSQTAAATRPKRKAAA